MLRKSNFLPDGSKGDQHLLRRKDIEIGPNFVIVNVSSSKTFIKGEKVLNIPIARSQDYIFDVFSRLIDHLRAVPVDGDSFLFQKVKKTGNFTPLMYKDVLQFIAVLRSLVLIHRI